MPLASTTDEAWSFNGTSLNMPYWNITTWGGSRFSLPALRGSDYDVPYRAGQQWRAKYPNSRVVTLIMWVAGIDSTTGNPAADQRLAFNDNLRTLRQLFWTRNLSGSVQGTLTRKWYITPGGPGLVTATALAEIAGSMDPTMTGRTRADFQVDLLLSDPYFYGTQQTATLPYNSGQTVTNLGEGVAGEGLGSAFTVVLNGPLTNPTVTNVTAGVSVTYTGTIPSGSPSAVTLDAVNYTAALGDGTNVLANVTHAGSRLWMGLIGGANTVVLTSTSGTDTGTAVLTWTPPYV